MSLRTKVLLIIGATWLILIVTLYLASRHIWLYNSTVLENQAMQANVNRVNIALSDDLNTLSRLVGDWSAWDDTYAFIENGNAAYIASNLTDETFAKDKVSLMLFINTAGELVYGKMYDMSANAEVPLPSDWISYRSALTGHTGVDGNIMGLITLGNRPLLVSSRPILTSNYSGPIRGSLIMGRDLDKAEFHRLSKITGLSVEALAVNDLQQSADFQAAYTALVTDEPNTLIKTLDEDEIAGFAISNDLADRPAALLRVSAPREIYAQGQRGLAYLMLSLTMVGLVFGALTFFLLDRLLLTRLSRLSHNVTQIGAGGDLAARVPVQGRDELTRLAADINQMLAALQRVQSSHDQLLEETRRQLKELSVSHTAAIATARSATLDQALQEIAQSTYDLFNAANVMVLLMDPASDDLLVRASVGLPEDALVMRRIKRGNGIIGRVAQTGQPALVPDVHRDRCCTCVDARTRSEICVPLGGEDRFIGVISVASERLNAFSESDLQWLITLGHNLGAIIDNIRLLEEVRAAHERLKELDRLKSQFLASMSHELRTPLNAIIGFSELLIDGVSGELNAMQRGHVQHIYASSQHLLALIGDVLDLSKLQAGRMTLDRHIVELPELTSAIKTIILPVMQRKRQQFDIVFTPDLPPVYADPLRLKQVLLNLLSNASKFTSERGKISLSITRQESDRLLFSICDNGLGIPAAQQAAIFEEFQQASHSLQQGGTGLGLAITRRLVELHGGTIWVESAGQPGLGSTFCFTLPVQSPAALDHPDRPMRILMVDDDDLLLELLETVLPQPDYEVTGLRSAALARDYLQRTVPDIILLDLLMPETNGFEFLAELRAQARTQKIPVLVLTAKLLTKDEQVWLDNSAQAVIIKNTLRRDRLLAEIRRLTQIAGEQCAA